MSPWVPREERNNRKRMRKKRRKKRKRRKGKGKGKKLRRKTRSVQNCLPCHRKLEPPPTVAPAG